ncbi:MAG: nuclear transport factor 2 family protein [Acidimicrobiia bacterium]
MIKVRTLGIVVALALLVGAGVQAGASSDTAAPVGARLMEALVAKDFDRAESLLAPDIEFKGYTPTKGFFELSGSDAVMGLYHEWYEADSVLDYVDTEEVVDRHRVGYRIRWTSPESDPYVFAQQAFYDVAGDRITHLQLVCSGDRPLPS